MAQKQTLWGGWRTRITRQGWLCQALGKLERLTSWLGGRPVTSRLTPRQAALGIERFEERVTPTVADVANLDAVRLPTVNTDPTWGFNSAEPLPDASADFASGLSGGAWSSTTLSTIPDGSATVTGPGWLLGGSELQQASSGRVVASTTGGGCRMLYGRLWGRRRSGGR